MARVHYRKARKAYPDSGIEAGQMYYYCKIKTGPRSSRELRSLQPFPRSQLTSSEFLGRAYDLEDQIAALDFADVDSAVGDAESIVDEIDALGDEQQDKLDNMPDGLREGPTGELLQERVDMCEDWASNIEGALGERPDEVEKPESDQPDREDFADDDAYDEAQGAWQEAFDLYEAYLQDISDWGDNVKGFTYEGQ